ncbi:cholinephosphate cytidylyltransferase [Pholiota molesta]|nr:cholinephosphate cytidylyltransferase [Pholiota molesta]
MSVETARTRTLHSKRSFGKYPKAVDSPAYDASEEDNDPLTDDGASAASPPIAITRQGTAPIRPRHHLAQHLLSDSDGVDSPTYDGDIESSTTAGADTPQHPTHPRRPPPSSPKHTCPTHPTPPRASKPLGSASHRPSAATPAMRAMNHGSLLPVFISPPPAVAQASRAAFNPAALTPEDIQTFVGKAIEGESWRKYQINPPPTDRPVRRLLHNRHALQLRQAKLSFPSVYLLVGVNSDEQVWSHKARTVMIHAERLEAVRHCRWVDEVVDEAPWVIDEAFLRKYEIDYVAHDEDAYASAGHDDVYSYVKSQGKFIPTRRTPGVSTSELLERIVSGYRNRDFDEKLTKMGHAELRAEGSDYDGQSRRASRSGSPTRSGASPPLASPGRLSPIAG